MSGTSSVVLIEPNDELRGVYAAALRESRFTVIAVPDCAAAHYVIGGVALKRVHPDQELDQGTGGELAVAVLGDERLAGAPVDEQRADYGRPGDPLHLLFHSQRGGLWFRR